MKTRERILQVALNLFNEAGEPNVTTQALADTLEISPGNLYYHFHNKADIVSALFDAFEAELMPLLEPQVAAEQAVDPSVYLHLIFEVIARYAFIYRDLVNILGRHARLARRFRRLLQAQQTALEILCQTLLGNGLAAQDQQALSRNLLLVTTWWTAHELTRQEAGELDLNRGIAQALGLLLPWLPESERPALRALAGAYLGD